LDAHNSSTIYRLDYAPSLWLIESTRLHFRLDATRTLVDSQLRMACPTHQQAGSTAPPLRLDGVDVHLESVAVDGVALEAGQYKLDEQSLTLYELPARCVLTIRTLINPQENTALEGLYRSSGNFCTQCEAEGFRKITYYLDRPDVLSVFDVTIEADANEYPVMLSNGNQVDTELLDDGWHRIRWHDPHPKPCYLFALVAGRLAVIEDHFMTASGRRVVLQIYVQQHNIQYCDFAMGALKRSMRWDEQHYGFEYDLERFMIVAVDDFNMGAMENKGLNIFNSRFVLADHDTATDADFLGIEAVIAHEYFHNWTGNRITCRDWFQLSLKEGLTVYRDQCFSSDMHSAIVKRIEDVRLLRARQFAEDASPMAHPIRPESYIEINNFYTLTVYEKGAEVIRMLNTLLGADAWRKGIDEYVRRHDGSATTCDAFIDALQSVTDTSLQQFRLWYSTAGTPTLVVNEHYDATTHRYRLSIRQFTTDTPGQSNKLPLHIPIVMGLLDATGESLSLTSPSHCAPGDDVMQIEPIADDKSHSVLLHLTQNDQYIEFDNIHSRPTASLLRGFSAPVKLNQALDEGQLALLIAHDADPFNRWEALQRLSERVILAELGDDDAQSSLQALNDSLGSLLADSSLDDAFKAEALQLPGIDTLAESLERVDYQRLGLARDTIAQAIAERHETSLKDLATHARDATSGLLDDHSMGARKLANTALLLLTYLNDDHWVALAHEQFLQAGNMTDRLAALSSLCHIENSYRAGSLQVFLDGAKGHKLVIDKWFSVQASSRHINVMDEVLALYSHPQFDIRNPNRVRALVAGFAINNPVAFHAPDGRGYRFLADRVIELDALNPQLAAGLVTPLTRWSRLIDHQQKMMREQLARILAHSALSPDVYEHVSKSLS